MQLEKIKFKYHALNKTLIELAYLKFKNISPC